MAASAPRSLVKFDRTVSEGLMELLTEGGAFREPLEFALDPAHGLDPQLRAAGGRSSLTLYSGLTKVLDLSERKGRCTLNVHPTHEASAGFVAEWRHPRDAEALRTIAPDVVAYLGRVTAPGAVAARHSSREGKVQTMIGTARDADFAAFQREAVPSFTSQVIEQAVRAPIRERILGAIAAASVGDPWWPGVRDRGAEPALGSELDALAIDSDGRLLAIEIKPANELKGITWGPAQARCYSELFALWLELDADARQSIESMCSQRRRLGMAAPPEDWPILEQPAIRVVPVVAVGSGTNSKHTFDRLRRVHVALQATPPVSARLDPLEVWLFAADSLSPQRWRPDFDELPPW